MVYGETGRTPLTLIIETRMICFWHRVSTGEVGKLSYKMLDLLNKLNHAGQFTSSWLSKIERILTSCGMRDVWLNPTEHNHAWVKKILKNRLSEIYDLNWHRTIMEKSSCLIYRTFKENFKFEKYITLLDNSNRIAICKFRCRNSKIPVVTLGYARIDVPYDQRLCTACNMNEIGDEYHYILQCPTLSVHRNSLIANYYVRNPSMYKLVQLFQSKNRKTLINLAKFIKEINRLLR